MKNKRIQEYRKCSPNTVDERASVIHGAIVASGPLTFGEIKRITGYDNNQVYGCLCRYSSSIRFRKNDSTGQWSAL